MRIAPRIAADGARRNGIEIAANPACADRRACIAHRLAERFEQRFTFFQEHERRAPRRAWSKPGQLRQELHELFDFRTGGERGDESERANHQMSSDGGGFPSRAAAISPPGKRTNTARTI